MTVRDAMNSLGCASKAQLARVLGMHRQGVQQWGDMVPEMRQYQIESILRQRDAAKNKNASAGKTEAQLADNPAVKSEGRNTMHQSAMEGKPFRDFWDAGYHVFR